MPQDGLNAAMRQLRRNPITTLGSPLLSRDSDTTAK